MRSGRTGGRRVDRISDPGDLAAALHQLAGTRLAKIDVRPGSNSFRGSFLGRRTGANGTDPRTARSGGQ